MEKEKRKHKVKNGREARIARKRREGRQLKMEKKRGKMR